MKYTRVLYYIILNYYNVGFKFWFLSRKKTEKNREKKLVLLMEIFIQIRNKATIYLVVLHS